MHIANVEKTLDYTPSDVFAALADIPEIHQFYSLLTSSPHVDGSPKTGLNAQRVCHFKDGNWLKEKVVEFKPNELLRINIEDGSMPLKYCRVDFQLTPLSGNKTHLKIIADYQLKMGLVGKVLNRLVVNRQFTQNLTTMINGLDAYVKQTTLTGELV